MKLEIEEFLKKRKESKPSFLFDLRGAEEFEADHILGAYNLPIEFFDSNLQRLPFSGDLLFYDGGEGAVNQAVELLDDNGFTDFYYAEEGFEKIKESLEGSPYEVKLACKGDDSKETKMEVIQNLLEYEINPRVASHGGFFTLLDVEDNNVYVELGGGCQGCGMVDVTLRQGVEQRMREVFPDMVALIDKTDHADGNNPYYQPEK